MAGMLYTGSKKFVKVWLTPLPPPNKEIDDVRGTNNVSFYKVVGTTSRTYDFFTAKATDPVRQLSSQNHSPSITGEFIQVK